MYEIHFSRQFKKSIRKIESLPHFKAEEMEATLEYLRKDELLPKEYGDHALIGNMKGKREFHLRGDLLVVYKKEQSVQIIDMIDIGSHSSLFNK